MSLPGAGGQSFFAYCKSAAADAPVLAAMDLSRAGKPELVPANGEDGDAVFAISWDRHRTFSAASREEAVKWVDAISRAQLAARRAGLPAPGAPPSSSLAFSPGASTESWGASRARGGAGEATGLKGGRGGASDGGGCCTVA